VPHYLGLAGDDKQSIADLIRSGIMSCDGIIMTGGVSAGDYDMTPAAMEDAGAEVLVRGVAMKPGMACAYGSLNGKLLFGLSGNPASSLTNFYAVVLPALRKMCGCREPLPRELPVTLAAPFPKKSKTTRFLRGTLDLSDGTARMILSKEQGNAVLSSAIGCNVMALVPAGSGALEKGTILKGFLL
jgi:molybdopterin molybdotransferase